MFRKAKMADAAVHIDEATDHERRTKIAVLGFVFLTMALTLPAIAFGDVDFKYPGFVVYDHQTRSHLPVDPDCHPAADSGCGNTSLVEWKFGPITLNDLNKYGDALYYQLQEDYTIDLSYYLNSYYYMSDNDQCLSTANQQYWYYQLPSYMEDHELRLWGKELTIRRGYRWDGSSIEIPPYSNFPWPLVAGDRIAAKPFSMMRASLVHDALYEFPIRRMIEHDCDPGDGRCGSQPGALQGGQWRLMADCILYALSRQDGTARGSLILPLPGTARGNFNIIRSDGAGYTDPDRYPNFSWKYHATADAGTDQVIECSTANGIAVELNGSDSRFWEGDHTTERYYQWKWDDEYGIAYGERPIVHFDLGIHTVTLIVSDGDDFDEGPFGDSDQVTITIIEDSEAPHISNPGDIDAVNEPGQCSARIYFSLSATDNCVEPSLSCTHAAGDAFPVGQTDVQCEAEDSNGNVAETEFSITVEDTEAPVIDGVAGPISVWEPSHDYITLMIADFVLGVSDNCSTLTLDDLVITGVTSNEPDDGKGDGRTTDDVVIAADGKSVDLRAERQGNGTGRTYTVDIQAVDEYGNTIIASFEVEVEQSKKR